jgi:hypothetical protein
MQDEQIGFTPDDFDELFSSQECPLIVGGQAVNTWAIHYLEKSKELQAMKKQADFLSKDADVLMPMEHARKFAERADWVFRALLKINLGAGVF